MRARRRAAGAAGGACGAGRGEAQQNTPTAGSCWCATGSTSCWINGPSSEARPAGGVRHVQHGDTAIAERRRRHRHRPGRSRESWSSPTTRRSRAAPTADDGQKHLRAQEVAPRTGCRASTSSTQAARSTALPGRGLPDRDHFGRIFFNQANLSADRASRRSPRDGLLHRRRRLRPGHVGRGGDRAQPGHHLPRRTAAGEGRDRRRSSPPRNWAAATSTPAPPASSTTSPRTTARACDRPPHRRHARSPRTTVPMSARTVEPHADPSDALRRRPGRRPRLRRPRGDPPDRRRLRVHEFKAEYGETLVTGLRAHPRAPWWGSWPTTASSSPNRRSKATHFIELCNQRGSRWCSCRTSPASWSAGGTERAASPGTAPSPGDRGRDVASSQAHRRHRRLVRRRQLRMCGRALFARGSCGCGPTRDLGDGRRAGRVGAGDRARFDDPAEEDVQGADPRPNTSTRKSPYYSTARLWDDGVIDPPTPEPSSAGLASVVANAPVEPGVLRRFGCDR